MSEHLFWGGCDTVALAKKYGTPLYVFSEDIIRARCGEISAKFLQKWQNTRAFYASKAFLTMAMARIIQSEGLGLDLVSGGEIYTAHKAGFNMENTLFHGSSKSDAEISEALRCGVGRIVIDNSAEISQIMKIAKELGTRAKVLIRVAPGVAADTHKALQTAHRGGKFGVPICELDDAVKFVLSHGEFELFGFHFHVGSMIYSPDAHIEATKTMLKKIAQLKKKFDFDTRELDVGGGFGVALSPEEPTPDVSSFTDPIMQTIENECASLEILRPAIFIEPGRWVVSESGITLYSVENIKKTEGATWAWINVDGGMADNPRHCLYNAEYRAVLANKLKIAPAGKFAIGGRCCESGDVLIERVSLPEPARGDVLALFNTGAYTFSMSSNYNRLPRPAVVFVSNGESKLVVARQNYEDLLAGEIKS